MFDYYKQTLKYSYPILSYILSGVIIKMVLFNPINKDRKNYPEESPSLEQRPFQD